MKQTIGSLVKAGMKARGWSARQLAMAIGYKDHRMVYRWLNGRATPSPETLRLLVAALGLDRMRALRAVFPWVGWFLGDEG